MKMLSKLFLVNLVVTLKYVTIFGKSGKHGDHDHDHHYLRKSYVPELKPAVDPMFEYYISSKDCDSYDWGDSTYICSGLNHLWDCPEIPLEQRNNIGRAVFQTPDIAQNAAKLIVKGLSYNIHHDYTNNMQGFGDRYFETYPICDIGASDVGGCTTLVDTNAIGNTATQFDGLAHVMKRVGDKVDDNDPSKGLVFFNNFHYDDVFDNTSNSNFHYIGIEQLPPFFTRCILIDVVNYLAPKSGVLARGYQLTKQDLVETLAYQGLYLNKNFRFERGDAVVFRFGYSKYWYPGTTEYYDNDTPGVPFEVAKEFLWDTGVMIIGSDTWGVEPVSDENADFNLHRYWIVCGGGFLHEGLVLDEWADDAKKGFVPYIGVYSFAALPVTGAAGGAGKPVVWV